MFKFLKKRENRSKEHLRELARIRAKRYYYRHKNDKKRTIERSIRKPLEARIEPRNEPQTNGFL